MHLEICSPALCISIFTSVNFSKNMVRFRTRAERRFPLPWEYATWKNCFFLLNSLCDIKKKPKQQHFLCKDQRLTVTEHSRLTWSGCGSRTAQHRPARKHRSHVTANSVLAHNIKSWTLISSRNPACLSVHFYDSSTFLISHILAVD